MGSIHHPVILPPLAPLVPGVRGMSTVTVVEGRPCLTGYTRLLPAVEVIRLVWNIFSLNLPFQSREQQHPGEITSHSHTETERETSWKTS